MVDMFSMLLNTQPQPSVELGSANKPMVAVKSALRLYGSKVTLGKWLGGQDPEEPVTSRPKGGGAKLHF